MAIRDNLLRVRESMADAALACGREPGSIRLVAVSKKQPVELIREAYAHGQRDFGENYVQELLLKAEALSDLSDIRWHMIGHLQRNKVRQVVRAAAVVQAADSDRLALELGKRALEQPVPSERQLCAGDARLPVLVEVNVGGEESKSGCRPEELEVVLSAVEREAGLRLLGLMTVPPFTEDPEGARPYFDRLVALRAVHGGAERLPELSMGMTHDLEQAVAAGATIVRVGTAIFGARS